MHALITSRWIKRDKKHLAYLTFPKYMQVSCLTKFYVLGAARSVQAWTILFNNCHNLLIASLLCDEKLIRRVVQRLYGSHNAGTNEVCIDRLLTASTTEQRTATESNLSG